MTILNIVLPRLPEIQSYLSFHRELSIVTLLELFNYFCSPSTVPYFYDTKIVYIFICRQSCNLAFSSSCWSSVPRGYGRDFVGEGISFGVNSALHLMCTAVESVLMAESYTVYLYVQKHGSSHERPVKILINTKIDDTFSFPSIHKTCFLLVTG